MKLQIIISIGLLIIISFIFYTLYQSSYKKILVGAYAFKDNGWVWIESEVIIKRGDKVTLDILDQVPGLESAIIYGPMAVNMPKLIPNDSMHPPERYGKCKDTEIGKDGWGGPCPDYPDMGVFLKGSKVVEDPFKIEREELSKPKAARKAKDINLDGLSTFK